MNIAIDMRTYQFGGYLRGIGQYTNNFIKELAKRHKVTLLLENPLDIVSEDFIHHDVVWGYVSDNKQYDVFHIVDPMSIYEGIDSSFRLPVRAAIKTSTFYDIIPLLIDESLSGWPATHRSAYFARLNGLCSCDAVFPISDESNKQLMQLAELRVNPVVAYMGINVHAPLNKTLASDYILTVGGDDRHKGWDDVEISYLSSRYFYPDLRWIIIGEHAGQKRRCAGIEYIGCVSEKLKYELMHNAVATIVASHAEGLGLPAYEAMLAGGKVITRRIRAFADIPCRKFNTRSDLVNLICNGSQLAAIPCSYLTRIRAKHNWKNCIDIHLNTWERLLDGK